MKHVHYLSDVKSLVKWSLATGWQANKRLFVLLNFYEFVNGSLATLVNTFLAAKAVASVAALANGTVTIRTPLLYAGGIALFNLLFHAFDLLSRYYRRTFDAQTDLILANQFHAAVNRLNQEQIDDKSVQEKIAIADRNFYQLTGLSTSFVQLGGTTFTYITSLAVVWRYSWVIGTLLLAVTPLLAWSNVIKSRRQQKSWEESSSIWREQYQARDALLNPGNFFQLTLLGARLRMQEYWAQLQQLAVKKDLSMQRHNDLLDFAENSGRELLNIASKAWAIKLVAAAKLSFDQFLFVMGLIERAIGATWGVSYDIRRIQEGVVAGRAGKDLIDLAPMRPDGAYC